jgi:hypothetical protein
MKAKLAALIAAACAVAGPSAWSAPSPPSASPPALEQAVTTSSTAVVFAPMHTIPIDRTTVRSQGYATHPGPRNHHVTAAHGGPVLEADRPDIPGRT